MVFCEDNAKTGTGNTVRWRGRMYLEMHICSGRGARLETGAPQVCGHIDHNTTGESSAKLPFNKRIKTVRLYHAAK